jgi:hypothetical protein
MKTIKRIRNRKPLSEEQKKIRNERAKKWHDDNRERYNANMRIYRKRT